MKIKSLIYLLPFLATAFVSCDGDSVPGDSLVRGEVSIEVDSTFTVTGRSVYCPQIDSKSMTQLIGNLSIPEYGDLECSFVTQFMPAGAMNIPDSITVEHVDSMRLRMRFASTAFTGDSLAPQQLKVYPLVKQLPSDITNDFDPTGYYDVSNPLGVKGYTASHLGMADKVYKGQYYGETYDPTWERAIWVNMPKKMAVDVFNEYRNNPAIFQTPTSFAKYFPGVFVKPTFGRGLVIDITDTEMITYYHYTKKVSVVENSVSVTKDSVMVDSVTLFGVSPEIISSNNIRYKVSQNIKNRIASGETLIVAPAGYNVEIDFPAQEILSRYWSSNFNLAVINNLLFSIPVETVKNSHEVVPPPYLLMVKTSELTTFFAEGKIPDDKTSFWASYDSSTMTYNFTSMRDYIVELMKGGAIVDEKDCKFTLVPVWITTESSGTYEVTTVVTKCAPFISRPVMGRLKVDEAKVKFTFSKQQMK